MKSLKRILASVLCFCMICNLSFPNAYGMTAFENNERDYEGNSTAATGSDADRNDTPSRPSGSTPSNSDKDTISATSSDAIKAPKDYRGTIEIINRNAGTVPMNVDDTYQLDVKLTPENDDVRSQVKYKPYTPEVAEIDQNGLIIAKKIGYASIDVRIEGVSSTSISVNVTDKEIISIIFDANGGQFKNGEIEITYLGESGGNMSCPTPEHSSGKVPYGWYYDEECQKSASDYLTSLYPYPIADARLYMKWSDSYTITYDYGGVMSDGVISKVVQIPQGKSLNGTNPYFESDPSKYEGKLFLNWTNSAGEVISSIYNYIPIADETLTAQWTEDYYTILFDFNGVEVNGKTSQVTYVIDRQKLTNFPYFSPDPSQTNGKVLLGWLNSAGELISGNSSNYAPTGNETLTAYWSDYYTVT